MLQAFPKLRGPSPYNNNFWGVGSGATRVYTQTLTTYGQPILEIQTVTTSAVQGQQLGGGFKLSYMGVQSHMIAHNVLPSEMKRALQSVWDLAGFVDVSRTRPDNQVRVILTSAPKVYCPHNRFFVNIYTASPSLTPAFCVCCRVGTRGPSRSPRPSETHLKSL